MHFCAGQRSNQFSLKARNLAGTMRKKYWSEIEVVPLGVVLLTVSHVNAGVLS
jgi:hypothetical protein